ncbi:MAG: hypothetical protein OZ921_17070 [Sorangiineae bacterium]|nr:hypothetical protein [Sorangiineae bacterium]
MSVLGFAAVRGALLAGLDASFDAGHEVVLGAPSDGTAELAELAAGISAPARGQVRVAGADPRRDPATRRRIGALLADEPLPLGATVRLAVERALAPRRGGAPAAEQALAACGLAAWGPRRTDTLSPEERRAVALALALAVPSPALIVLVEPLANLEGVDTNAVRALLDARAEQGACVLSLTASPRDADALGGTLSLLERGRIVRRPTSALPRELSPGSPCELLVRSADARKLAALVIADARVNGVAWDELRAPNELRVRGADADALALAVMGAARDSGAALEALALVPPELELVRAATTGLAEAAREAAYRAYVEAARPRPAAAAPLYAAAPACEVATGRDEPAAQAAPTGAEEP